MRISATRLPSSPEARTTRSSSTRIVQVRQTIHGRTSASQRCCGSEGALIFAEGLLLIAQTTLGPGQQASSGTRFPHPLAAAQTCNGVRYRTFQVLMTFYKKTGQWPVRLEDLIPEFTTSLPIDPETGLPLAYEQRASGLDLSCAEDP